MPIDSNPLIKHTELSEVLKGLNNLAIQSIGSTASADPYVYGAGGTQTFADYQSLMDVASSSDIQAFLMSYNANTNPIPSDITKFVKDFVTSKGPMVNIDGVNVPDPAVVKAILTGFLNAFQQNITGSVTPLTAWPELNSMINLTGDISDPDQFAQLEAAFKDFIGRYPYASNGSVASNTSTADYAVNGFFKNWRDFTAISSVISGLPTADPTILGGAATVPTFEAIFNAFYPQFATDSPNAVNPSASPAGQTYFAEFLQQFYAGEVQRYGFFTPSHSLTNWIGYVQDLAGLTLVSPATRVPEIKTKILNNMLLLLISMIASIQNIAAAQANRLTLYSGWQRGYTSLLGQVHTFTATSQDRLRGAGDAETKARQDVQGTFNAALTQRLTSQKDVITDDAKALQSRVNQSSAAFNEQANINTAILQQLSTILATIMK